MPLGDDQWFNVVKWVIFATFESEEQGITSKNVDEKLNSTDPNVKRLLGVNSTPSTGGNRLPR